MPQTATQTRLQSNAMLVLLRLTHWNASVTDKPATAEVIRAAEAAPEAARVFKRLVDRKRMRPIQTATDRIKERHFRLTLPWDDTGIRLLPIAAHHAYVDEMDTLINDRAKAVKAFLAGYDDAVQEARTTLGSLWRETDYPTAAEIGEKIGAAYEFTPVPDGSHFTADLGEEEAARIRRDIEAHVQAKLSGAVADIYKRLGEAVATVAEKLGHSDDGKARIFRDSLLDNIRDLLDITPQLNVAGDAGLTHLCEQVRAAITGIEVDQLRPTSKAFDAGARRKIEQDMTGLADKFAGYFGAPAAE